MTADAALPQVAQVTDSVATRAYIRITEDIQVEILRRLADGESLRQICKSPGMPNAETVRLLRDADRSFGMRFQVAREAQADTHADQIVGLADELVSDPPTYLDEKGRARVDNGAVQARKVAIDAYKWVASKLRPRAYGEHVQIETRSVDAGATVDLLEQARVIALALRLAQGAEERKPLLTIEHPAYAVGQEHSKVVTDCNLDPSRGSFSASEGVGAAPGTGGTLVGDPTSVRSDPEIFPNPEDFPAEE